mgnify:CR=1 FL=1
MTHMAFFEGRRVLQELRDTLVEATDQLERYPNAAVFNCGKGLELACRWCLGLPLEDGTPLSDLLKDPAVLYRLGAEVDTAHLLKEARNAAAHGKERFQPDEARKCHDALLLLLQLLGIPNIRKPAAPSAKVPEAPPKVEPVQQGRLVPDWSTINGWEGDNALSSGERYLVELFDRNLGSPWQIYVRPNLLGLRPAIVLLNPEQQVIHIEVEEHDADLLEYNDFRQLVLSTSEGSKRLCMDPVRRTNLVRCRILEGPLAWCNEKNEAANAVRSFLYVHSGKRWRAKSLFARRAKFDELAGVIHRDDVAARGVLAFTTASSKPFGSQPVLDGLVGLRSFLQPPSFVGEKIEPLPSERRFIKTKWERASGSDQFLLIDEPTGLPDKPAGPAQTFERIRGVAGSGKSHLIALRAAAAARLGKRVLVTCYNITMANYLLGLVRRIPLDPEARERIDVRHFHGFVADQVVLAGTSWSKRAGTPAQNAATSPKSQPMYDIEASVEGLFATDQVAKGYRPPRYDAIYIDEGQDLSADVVRAIGRFLTEDSELVLVADHRQDLYGGLRLWPRLPLPFGPWKNLTGVSYRLPQFIVPWLNDLTVGLKQADEEELPFLSGSDQKALPATGSSHSLWWQDCDTVMDAAASVPEAVEKILREAPGTHPSEIAILTCDSSIGLETVKRMEQAFGRGSVSHIFGKERSEGSGSVPVNSDADPMKRQQKLAFYQEDGRFKACTIHSFKGWEAKFVVLVWGGFSVWGQDKLRMLYTACTRCKLGMVMLNADPQVARFRTSIWRPLSE